MPIETMDDILEQIADRIGVYGAHDDDSEDEDCECRVCFVSDLRERIDQAMRIEARLMGWMK
jgi:hypothetical protein